jgi:hypothetical protein
MTLPILALAALGGGCVGYALCLWQQAHTSAIHNEAIRDGVCDQYAAMKDGRNSDNLPQGRYAEVER